MRNVLSGRANAGFASVADLNRRLRGLTARTIGPKFVGLLKSDRLAAVAHISHDTAELERATVAGLSGAARAGFERYRRIEPGPGGEFESINAYLRLLGPRPLNNRSIKPSLFSHEIARTSNTLSRALDEAAVLPTGLVLFRGLSADPRAFARELHSPSLVLSSTSLEPSVAYDFARMSAQSTGEVPHLLLMELSAGVRGLYFGRGEQEVLLQRGVKTRVKAVGERTMRVRRGHGYGNVPFRVLHLEVSAGRHA